ncbi:MAG: 5-(carboxyamino)imidazole ribonucleotide mutase [Firmicutes bacterium]|nr:5-(carboxyamino)imidazole ribonucleotide mutase [Bacillota bacterium]
MAQVAVIVGSDSDLPVVKGAIEILEEFEVAYELTIASAHRTPKRAMDLAMSAEERGVDVIIAAAGAAAHLPGFLAAFTTVPVIGLPIRSGALEGLDALYSMTQMPSGVPVATVGINNAKNAALLAVAILGIVDEELRAKLKEYRKRQACALNDRAVHLEEVGLRVYLAEKDKEKGGA